MKLTVFQSDKGDCLLLTSSDGVRILADGGMRTSFRQHVAPTVGELREQRAELDVVYVSHIDEDHISGILDLMDTEVAWRVHDFQLASGNAVHTPPSLPRPPTVGEIWHNAFHEQLRKNAGPIADMLAATAQVLSGSRTQSVQELAVRHGELATSERQAIKLSRRVGSAQLGIPLNEPAGGKLMMVRQAGGPISRGSLSITILGPFERDLRALRKRWKSWLRANKSALKKIRADAKKDEELLAQGEMERVVASSLAAADELGQRDKVTAPNLASLMLLVEENGRSVLLTGDGHGADLIEGLRAAHKLSDSGGVHVDVLKVQHHGSEHNLDAGFAKAVTANHYVFCGNGAHNNPDLRVVKAIINSRIGSAVQRSRNAEVDQEFKLWFNSSSSVPGSDKNRDHMKKVEKLVRERADSSGGQMRRRFLRSSKLEIEI